MHRVIIFPVDTTLPIHIDFLIHPEASSWKLKMSGSLELLAAAFSAILGVEVVTPERGAQLGLPKISIHHLFRATYVMRPLENASPGEVFDINVTTLTGARIVVQVSNEFTIAEVKAAVEMKEKIPSHQQRLIFNSKPLEDAQTIAGVGIPPHGTIFLVVTLRGGGPALQLDPDELDPSFNYDFTHQVDDGKKYLRGAYEYQRPYGWFRYAIRVAGRTEYGGDDAWLGPSGIRTETDGKEWPVLIMALSWKACLKLSNKATKQVIEPYMEWGYTPVLQSKWLVNTMPRRSSATAIVIRW